MLSCTTLWFTIFNLSRPTYSDCRQFSDIHISQGSVATYLRCGGIFKREFVANLPLSLQRKNFENRLIFGKLWARVVSCFLTHGVYLLPAPDLSSKPAGRRCCRSTGQTDGHSTVLWRLPLTMRNQCCKTFILFRWSGNCLIRNQFKQNRCNVSRLQTVSTNS